MSRQWVTALSRQLALRSFKPEWSLVDRSAPPVPRGEFHAYLVDARWLPDGWPKFFLHLRADLLELVRHLLRLVYWGLVAVRWVAR